MNKTKIYYVEYLENKNVDQNLVILNLVEQNKDKTIDWFSQDLKKLETKFKKIDSEFEFEKAIDLFNTTPKNELVNYYLELLYLFKTTKENKGK